MLLKFISLLQPVAGYVFSSTIHSHIWLNSYVATCLDVYVHNAEHM